MLLVVRSQNVKYGAGEDGRWDALVEEIREERPHLLMLQECDQLADPEQADAARRALDMDLAVAPSKNLPTAVAWDRAALNLIEVETKYWSDLHHGYCAPRFEVSGLDDPLPVPLVAISTHLTPYSAQAAAQEAQLVGTRAYRYGGLGVLAGDINHVPLGDPETDWSVVQPYNRMSRCLRRSSREEPWRGDSVVGQTLRDGEFADVAGYLADLRADPSLREPTGKAGLVRVDQVHVTQALTPTIEDYQRVATEHSDHFGVVVTLDLGRVDRSLLRQYT